MSTNWKQIGKNSGNMSQYRNVTHNKLNYETGKWNSIYDVSGIKSKGYTFDISGQNIVLGVGTDKPFSRLSLGNNTDSGIFDPDKPGQLSAIALDESGNGHRFTGIFLNSKITSLDNTKTTGLQIMSSTSDFSMNDTTNTGKIILSNDNVTTIGGNSREKPDGYSNSDKGINIVLDVRGSIRTDGYINFFDNSGSDPTPDGSKTWDFEMNNNIGHVPPGSLFLAAGGKYGPEGLYFKSINSEIVSVATNTDISNTVSSGGGGDGAFDLSKQGGFGYILSKGSDDGNFGGLPVTINGKEWTPDLTDISGKSFNNALTIREGNLAVITPSGQELKVINPPPTDHMNTATKKYFTDQSGGIILAEKQILLGKIGTSSKQRCGYGLIDIQTVETVPSILSTIGSSTTFEPQSATNSIILLTRTPGTSGTSDSNNIGNIYDCNNTIIIGRAKFKNINTPNSLISISDTDANTGSEIIDISGSNLVFGKQNDLSGSPFSIIFGSNNKIDNSNKTGDSPEGKENVALGTNNNLYNSQNSFVQGSGNINHGNLNVIFGNNNKLGSLVNNSTTNQLGSNCFIQGNSNTIKASYDNYVNNVFIAGYNNQLDCSYSSFVNDTEDSHILLGSKAEILYNTGSDSSNVRFAFGTKAMEGNVFTIDISGNVEISGNLLVKGSQAIFRTELFDVSDANISLNANNGSPEGGGITLMDDNGNKGLIWKSTSIYGSEDYWDTSGSDISSNHIFANNIISNDISANDISCVDISASHFFGSFIGDVSGNVTATDISCVDISAVNFFSIGSSFFGDVHATKASSFNDISGNDASFNDVSMANIFLRGMTMYVENAAGVVKTITFPSNGGTLTTTTNSGGVDIANNLASGQLGSIPYQNAENDTNMLTPNTTTSRNFLSQTGTGTAGLAPLWTTLSNSDVGLSDVENTAISTFVGSSNITTVGTLTSLIISGDLSGNDASFNDLSLNYLYVNNDISANNIFLQGNISGNDASFNDISANHFYNNGSIQADLSSNGEIGTSLADISNNLKNLITYLRAIGIIKDL